jgi:uncharacterized C2H2 Zn-finger protein
VEKNENAVRSPKGDLLCPRCGSEMNRHAVKIDPSLTPGDRDADLGGVLQEFHTCPGCRYVLERRAR